ncbi:hypothetical protein GQ53DRAFT_823807 [Thozetella sp. PMI_491]|nr:hypothetical protein GQ53DRAFT_823807 [Thozetella sp. PMI_491]
MAELPGKFEACSNGCRDYHPDWDWVLRTNEDIVAIVYVDLDMDFLRPTGEGVFHEFNFSTIDHMAVLDEEEISQDLDVDMPRTRTAFFGGRGIDATELVTGPAFLHDRLSEYIRETKWHENTFGPGILKDKYSDKIRRVNPSQPHTVNLIQPQYIHPYNWGADGLPPLADNNFQSVQGDKYTT